LHGHIANPARIPAGLAPALLLCAAAGCESFAQDMSTVGQGLIPPSPEQAARMMLDPHDPDNRRRGTVLISNAPFGGAAPYLAVYRDRVQFEQDPLVKAASIAALGRFGQPEDAPMIAACLNPKENLQVRWEAAKALQRMHNPVVVPDLLATLRSDDETADVRVAAAVALGQYPQDNVFQALVEAIDQPQLALNEAAEGSLKTLTGHDFGLDSEIWLHWYNGTRQPFAGEGKFLYPTYSRKKTFMESIAFWSPKTFEQPGIPVGMEAEARKTYQDEQEPK
jgi:hypothetical protein